jgi:hypothetical protein
VRLELLALLVNKERLELLALQVNKERQALLEKQALLALTVQMVPCHFAGKTQQP